MLISIIIPAYNASKTICKTLESLSKQNRSDFEVLIIDDGSTDDTYEICKDYINQKENFKLIKQKNKGVSSARNLGLRSASGDYIVFIDADDFLSNTAIDEIYNHLYKNDSDIIFFDYYVKIENEEKYIKSLNSLQKDAILKDIMKGVMRGFVWNKIFKRNFILNNRLSFNEKLKYCEDEEFLLDAIWFSKEISYLERGLYYYIQHENSFTNQKMDDFFPNKFLPYILALKGKPYFKIYGKFLMLKAARLRLYRFRVFGNLELGIKSYIENFPFSLLDKEFTVKEKILCIIAKSDFLMRVYCSK
ncbi:glycosyltransferase family 2 protein [Acinetobacter baumannii]|nr:glycosyltransferase [Acinetobacter baumannii]